MSMMHIDFVAYYEKIFALKQYHQWTLSELEDMMPWELDVMVSFLNGYLETKELARQQAKNAR